ncbi:hypothetical protein FJQ98_10980 [Lysinibacillus agricola]|uniref:NIPSNAP domain-containing protein n=1 Tax=Lysinibacillus agricola TaxID=2590012 RepID=A0ABX7AYD1_9BACI|nr:MULTISPECIES: hypothetical protein [Lysinibacillus]KOS60194.1 hypothetical protein AN161_24120 [Lysinibacillus sp. FJAT-14222]QQP14482.1 hypothetical protein FJQ98_10980 [Lysinibacillus agricola]
MNREAILEILLYKLEEGTGTEFHKIMVEQSIPLHEKEKMKVISYGQSLHNPDSYYLIREYENSEHLENSQREFYSNSEWLNGPRDQIISKIKTSTKSIIPKTSLENL